MNRYFFAISTILFAQVIATYLLPEFVGISFQVAITGTTICWLLGGEDKNIL